MRREFFARTERSEGASMIWRQCSLLFCDVQLYLFLFVLCPSMRPLWSVGGLGLLTVSILLAGYTQWTSSRAKSLVNLKTNGNTPHQSLPVVVCIFITTHGLQTPTIWQHWFDDFQNHLRLTRDLPENLPGPNPWLRGVLTHAPDVDMAQLTDRTPPWLRPHVDPTAIPSAWGKLLPSVHQALKFAREEHPDGDYFLMLSDSTIPLKPFRIIWGEIAADSRSRIDVYCKSHFNGVPKHSQWLLLNRPHIDTLLQEPVTNWTTPPVTWVAGNCLPGAAAGDEYFPLKRLIFAREILVVGSSSEYAGGRESFELSSIIRDKNASLVDTLSWYTFVYWRAYKTLPAREAIGDYDFTHGHPSEFTSLKSGFLRWMVSRQNSWFMRKVRGGTRVADCTESPMTWLARTLGSPDLAKDTFLSDGTFIPYARPLAAADCALEDFLPTLWAYDSDALDQVTVFDHGEVS